MGGPPVVAAETKTRIVASVLAGEVRIAEAARKGEGQRAVDRVGGRLTPSKPAMTASAAGRSGPFWREQ